MNPIRFAVLGAGSGGQCMAAHLGTLGHRVALYDIDQPKIERLQQSGTITLSGALEGSYQPEAITCDIRLALQGAEIVMVATTTDAHRRLTETMAPYITDDMLIVLCPGHTGGAIEVSNYLARKNARPVVAEMQDLLYACRQGEAGTVTVPGMKRSMDMAVLPTAGPSALVERIMEIYPQLHLVKSVLHTGFDNISALIHPIPTLLNAGRSESGEPFKFYMDGITPSVARVLEDADRERIAVARAYGVDATSIPQWQKNAYNVEGKDFYEIFHNNKSYEGIAANSELDNRFLTEDVPSGLVPLSALGALAKVPTPVMDSLIGLSSSLLSRDFRAEGRTLERLGLSGMTVEEIQARYV